MNYSVFQFLNNLAEKYDWIDDLMEAFAQDIVWILLVIMACLWFTGKAANQKMVFFSLLSASVALLIASLILSPAIDHSRPFVEHQVHQLIPHAADASFPSDHATLSFSIAFSVYLTKRRLGVILLALAVLTGIARVYVGVHYPGDIVGAMVLSLLVSVIVHAFRRRLDAFPQFFIRLQRKLTTRIRHIHEK
jgi:undecaprenyl-diphosphatase